MSDILKTTEIALSVTVGDEEVFRVASDGRGTMPSDNERDAVLRALANGLATLLGTDLTDDPLNPIITTIRWVSARAKA